MASLSSSDCEAEVGLGSDQFEVKGSDGKDVAWAGFSPLRQYSYSHHGAADEGAFVIGEKAIAVLQEMNLFEQEHQQGQPQIITIALMEVNDLFKRISSAVANAQGT